MCFPIICTHFLNSYILRLSKSSQRHISSNIRENLENHVRFRQEGISHCFSNTSISLLKSYRKSFIGPTSDCQ